MDLTVRVVNDISSVDPAAWDALDHGASPFLRSCFLRALHDSESIGGDSGWDPFYILVHAQGAPGAEADGALLGAVACFRKAHSYGEYIFDFGWANASVRASIPYYPKLVIAAPVTPATGRRILLADTDAATRETVTAVLFATVRELADTLECSSIHWLFTLEPEQELLSAAGYLPRATFQFHFHNRGYAEMDAFLASLSSRKRKQMRKERARAHAAIDDLRFIAGTEMSARDVADLDRFYRTTTYRHGGQDYLRPGFFEALVRHAPELVRYARASKDGRAVAGALYLQSECALYGRYWGCTEEIPFLHFEVAYYAGIEHCIREGLPLFEAGAQGEHKLLRGFDPAPTYSSHFIRHDGLREAVRRSLVEEHRTLPLHMQALTRFAPYKRDE